MLAYLLLLLFLPLPLLYVLWLKYYNKIIVEGMKFPGENYRELRVTVKPSSSVLLEVEGKCTILVNGVNGWATIRVNGKAKEKVFKIRLLKANGRLEIINESKVFSIDVIVRCSGKLSPAHSASGASNEALDEGRQGG